MRLLTGFRDAWVAAALSAGATLLGLIAQAPASLACASCGSGGDDPLILFPNERTKALVSVARTTGFRNVEADGSWATAGGPSVKEAVTVAFGQSFGPRAFATLTAPFLRNRLGDDSRAAAGDPSLAARYTAVLPDITTPWVPQLQGLVGYKHGQARSLRESEELKTQLDVFGTGFSEVKAGLDVWWGLAPVKGGMAHVVVRPLARSFDGIEQQPGLIQRSTATVGMTWLGSFKTSGGVTREARGERREDGESVADSEQLNHGAFLTQDWQLTPLETLRLVGSRQAAWGTNRRTARSDTVSLAFMRSF